MAKKSNEWIKVVGVIILLALLYVGIGGKVPSFSISPLEGFQILSSSQVSINNQNQLIMTTTMGGAQKAAIDLSSAASSALQQVGRSPKNIILSAELLDQSCKFRIDYLNEIIYGANLRTARYESCSVNVVNPCVAAGYSLYVCPSTKDPITGQQISPQNTAYNLCYDYQDSPVYQKGYINTYEFSPTWAVKISVIFEDGTRIEKTLDNNNKIADLGAVGQVEATGGLVDSLFCGSPTNVLLVRGLTETTWSEVPYYLYNDYFSAYAAYSGNKFNIPVGWSTGTALNTKIAAITANRGTTGYENYFSYTPSGRIINPVLVWTLNTDSVSILEPKYAKAQIVSFETQTILETTTAKVYVTVKNIGLETDNFDITIKDCNPQDITIAPQRVTIAVGQQQKIELLAEGTARAYQCTISAIPINNPTEGKAETTIQFDISKRACPAEFSCCKDLANYNDRGCKDTSKVIVHNDTKKDNAGNIIGYEYESYIEIQHYSCLQTACSPSTSEQLEGSAIVTIIPIGSTATPPTPTPYVTPQGTPTLAPQPTIIIIGSGYQPTPTAYIIPIGGGVQPEPTGGNIDGILYIAGAVVVIGIGYWYFMLRKKGKRRRR